MTSLKDKYCIVGVGETEYSRHSGRSTRAMAVEAVRNAMRDAGLDKTGVDGIMSYQSGDSTFGNFVAPDLGIRLNFYMDVYGGAHRSRDGRHRGRDVPHHRDLPLHERLLRLPDRRHRGPRGPAGARARPRPGPVRDAQRGAELRPQLHAS